MARLPRRTTTINTALQKRRTSTQRERLLGGMITAANRDGYAGANVSEVIGEAGVSRPTFYEYFADKDACFLGALADVQGRLLIQIHEWVQQQPPEAALQATVEALIAFASSEP